MPQLEKPAPINLVAERKARESEDVRQLREHLFEACRAALDELNGELAGFALVAWGKNGGMKSAYNASSGPVGPALVPTLVSDALNRHVAVMLAREESDDVNSG
jgi:hypothetical protein